MGDQYSHLLNQVHRRQLRAAGLAFCDDEFQEKSPAYDELLEQLDHLMGGAVSASSTDDPSQGPGMRMPAPHGQIDSVQPCTSQSEQTSLLYLRRPNKPNRYSAVTHHSCALCHSPSAGTSTVPACTHQHVLQTVFMRTVYG